MLDIDGIAAGLKSIPLQDQADAMIAAVEWRSALGREDLGRWIDLDGPALIRSIVRGRAALDRAGFSPDGSPRLVLKPT